MHYLKPYFKRSWVFIFANYKQWHFSPNKLEPSRILTLSFAFSTPFIFESVYAKFLPGNNFQYNPISSKLNMSSWSKLHGTFDIFLRIQLLQYGLRYGFHLKSFLIWLNTFLIFLEPPIRCFKFDDILRLGIFKSYLLQQKTFHRERHVIACFDIFQDKWFNLWIFHIFLNLFTFRI